MAHLQWWMRGVGVFYILLSLLNVRFLTAPLDIGYGWLLFGLDLAIVGALLVAGAKDPRQNRILVQVVLVQEVIRGIVADIYAIWQGGSLELYIGFIVVHAVIIVTGITFSRRDVVRRPDMVTATSSQAALYVNGEAESSGVHLGRVCRCRPAGMVAGRSAPSNTPRERKMTVMSTGPFKRTEELALSPARTPP